MQREERLSEGVFSGKKFLAMISFQRGYIFHEGIFWRGFSKGVAIFSVVVVPLRGFFLGGVFFTGRTFNPFFVLDKCPCLFL